MTTSSTRMLLHGNHAVAWGARLARPQVIPVYPITPQTPILEKLMDFHAAGELDAEILTPESEHSAMAACITASLTGARVFTATASQGLMLMHELLHYACGARAPIVMFNVNRTVGSPWGFWPDQTDSMAQRDTGWIQFYTEHGQESLDTVIQAYRIAEQLTIPVMISHDAFYVSHAMEAVDVPPQALVDEYLPPYAPAHFLDPERGESWGNVVSQELYRRHRQDIGTAMDCVPETAAAADADWQDRTGRGYGLIDAWRCDDAETIIVTLGSMCGTAREAVDRMRAEGKKIGLLKVRLFRPLPVAALRTMLAAARDIVVLDRNFSPGVGGVLHHELKAALYGLNPAPRLHGHLAGVGGVNVSPAKIRAFVATAESAPETVNESLWME